MTNDYPSYAPYYVGNAIQYPQWHSSTPPTRPNGAQIIDPNVGFNEQIYAMVWGSIYFPSNWSNSWIDDARIVALQGESITWPANETYAFYDPKTGITYKAHTSGTETILGDVHQKGVAARMLEWANKLTCLGYICQMNGNVPACNGDGSPILILDGQGHPQLDPQGGTIPSTLASYVQNIDIMRQLTATFIRPLDDGNLPQP
jgi:hypothetical protein